MTTRVGRPARRTSVGALLALVRWPNALMAAAGVVVGAWWARPEAVATSPVAWGVAAAVAAAASIYAFNDLFDAEIDRVAHPERPLPSGRVGVAVTWAVAVAGAVAASLLAYGAGQTAHAIATIAVVVGYVYSILLKPRGLPGNVAVALVASLPFVVGAEAVGHGAPGLALLAVAAPLHLAREVVKDVADAPADAGRRRTLPVVHGAGVARAVALAAVAGHATVASFLFAPAGWRRVALLPAVALAAVAAARATTPARAARSSTLLKLAMLLAMGALPFVR